MQSVKLNKISQRAINDAGADALCMAVSDILMAWGNLKRENRNLAPLTLADIDRIVDKCIAAGALRDLDKDGQSDGFVSSHEKIAEVVGLKGFTKVREPYDKHKIINLLQWQAIVEIRSGGHSMVCHAWSFNEAEQKAYAQVMDPWPKTDDVRLDLDRGKTQKLVGKSFVDSRSIKTFAWYKRNNTDWI